MDGIQAEESAPVVVEVWAELGCPWCYIGKHRLQEAIGRRSDANRFAVKIRSFELDPDAPTEPETIESAFIRSHGGDAAGVRAAEGRAQALARREGLPFELERLHANTFDLHRVLHDAEESGQGLAFFSLVQDRYFAGDLSPFAADALVEAAESVGLSGARVPEILVGDDYADAVRADVQEGRELGVRGVPITVFDRRLAASGRRRWPGTPAPSMRRPGPQRKRQRHERLLDQSWSAGARIGRVGPVRAGQRRVRRPGTESPVSAEGTPPGPGIDGIDERPRRRAVRR